MEGECQTSTEKTTLSLVLLRHCESLFNSGADVKSPNVGLSAKGEAQAAALKGMADAELVICSPMLRCKQTLELSHLAKQARKNKRVIVQPLCREHCTDACDFMEGEPNSTEDIESEEAVLLRVAAFQTWLRELHKKTPQKKGGKWLIVGHADFFFYLTSSVTEGERFGQWLDNGELYGHDISIAEDELEDPEENE